MILEWKLLIKLTIAFLRSGDQLRKGWEWAMVGTILWGVLKHFFHCIFSAAQITHMGYGSVSGLRQLGYANAQCTHPHQCHFSSYDAKLLMRRA